MGLEEARDILNHHHLMLSSEQYEQYSYDRQLLIDALGFALDRLNKEIDSYRNV